MGAGVSSAKSSAAVPSAARNRESDGREVAIARHLMAMDRLGERMVKLEGRVEQLPAKQRSSTSAIEESNGPLQRVEEPDDLWIEIDSLETAIAQLPELEALDAPRKVLREQLNTAKAKKLKRDGDRAKAEHCLLLGRVALDQRDYEAAVEAFEDGTALDSSTDGCSALMSSSLTSRLQSELTIARAGLAAQNTARAEARGHVAAAEACSAAQDFDGAIVAYQAAIDLDVNQASLTSSLEKSLETIKVARAGAVAAIELAAGEAAAADRNWDLAIQRFKTGLEIIGKDDAELTEALRAGLMAAEAAFQLHSSDAEGAERAGDQHADQHSSVPSTLTPREAELPSAGSSLAVNGGELNSTEDKLAARDPEPACLTPADVEPNADARKVIMARHIMAMDQLGERMVQLEGKVALLPTKADEATADVEASNDVEPERQVVLARHNMALDQLSERMVDLEGKVALLPLNVKLDTVDAERTTQSGRDKQEIRMSQHIMALDRLGERMFELEDKVTLLPAKVGTAALLPVKTGTDALVETPAKADDRSTDRGMEEEAQTKAQTVKSDVELMAARDRAQHERRLAAQQRKQTRENNPNWRKQLEEQHEEEKKLKILTRNLEKQIRREDHERLQKREAEDKIIKAKLQAAFDHLDAASLLSKYVSRVLAHHRLTLGKFPRPRSNSLGFVAQI